MEKEERGKLSALPHVLTLDERKKLSVSGVEEVVNFDEGQVSVQTVKGLLLVRGENLRVDKLEKSAGELTISGLVTDLAYEETGPGTGFWSKLFRG